MYDRYEEHKAQQLIESCNAYLYIAKTNPGKSGNRSRKWLAEHYDQVPAYLKDEIERIDTDARIYNLYMATLGWEI
jgi:hypothetical protein